MSIDLSSLPNKSSLSGSEQILLNDAGTAKDVTVDVLLDKALQLSNAAIMGSAANNLPTIRPSLNLDFANSQVVDPRITFTRASTATRVNAKGLIETVASGTPRIDYDPVTGVCKGLLIEESRVNLLTYSEQFDNAAWVKARSTVSLNQAVAPDGTVSADMLREDTTASNTHFTEQVVSTVSGTTYTFSFYAKAAGRDKINIAVFTNASTSTNFDLTAVTASNDSGSIVSVGNGWFRCTHTHTSGFTGSGYFDIYLRDAAGASPYTGDGTSGIFIWGAQLEAGAFPTSYQPSTETWTARASTATFFGSNGLIQTASSGVARMNYNPMNLTVAPKLLLEAAATNMLTYSESFDNAAWVKTAVTATANATTAPDGTATADKLVEAASTGSPRAVQNVTVSSGAAHTYTVYLKAGERTQCHVLFYDGAVTYSAKLDLSTGAVTAGVVGGTSDGAPNTTFSNVGNGWFRAAMTRTTGGVSAQVSVRIFNSTDSYTGDGVSGLFIWGAQLEAGAFPTSYIPTVASQVTRVADSSTSAQTTRAADVASMTGANFSSWYRQTEGVFVLEMDGFTTSGIAMCTTRGLGYGPRLQINTANQPQFNNINDSSVLDAVLTSAAVVGLNTFSKSALAYKTNDYAMSVNGNAVLTDTSASVPTGIADLRLGCDPVNTTQLNGHLARLAYYPKRVTNAELQALSTQ